jgi:serine/threonine protein phosphatase PrpC
MTFHMDAEVKKSLCCVASLTSKLDKGNEDAAAILGGNEPGFHGVAIADGLGSYTHAREAAQFVTAQAADLSKTLRLDSGESLSELFTQVRHGLRSHFRHRPDPPLSEEGSYGTTLLVAVETCNQLLVAYAGNGGIWHLRGNFDDSAGPTRIPWCSVNYLQPHSVFIEGKEHLYNLIDLSEQFDDHPPTVITVNKDLRFGDILALCTDGIYSADKALHGTDPKGDLWIGAGAAMVAFYEFLRSYFSQPCEGPKLEELMQQYLRDLGDRDLLDDDATLGIIITGEALLHQQKKRRSVPTG